MLETDVGDIEAPVGLDQDRAVAFVRALEATAGTLVSGALPHMFHVDETMEEAFDAVGRLQTNRVVADALGNSPAVKVVANELVRACCAGSKRLDDVPFEVADLILTMQFMAGFEITTNPGAAVRAAIAAASDEAGNGSELVALRDALRDTPAMSTWATTVDAVADVMEVVRDRVLPFDATPSDRAAFDEEITALRGASRGTAAAGSVDQLLAELASLVGIAEVKSDIAGLMNVIQVQQMRAKHGLSTAGQSRHLVFTGNPGTGKTTVARLVGEAPAKPSACCQAGTWLRWVGRISSAGFVGQTAIKTAADVRACSVEAFSSSTRRTRSYGKGATARTSAMEAIDTLVKLMEDHRD